MTSTSDGIAPAPAFDYCGISGDLAARLQGIVTALRGRLQRTSDEVIGTGRLLLEAKKALGHGRYTTWLDSEVGMPRATAARLSRTASVFRGLGTAALDRIEPTAMYLLSCDRCPLSLREWIIEQLNDGETYSASQIREVIRNQTFAAIAPKSGKKVGQKGAAGDDGARVRVEYIDRPDRADARDASAWRAVKEIISAGGSIHLASVSDDDGHEAVFRAVVYRPGKRSPDQFTRLDLESVALAAAGIEPTRKCSGCLETLPLDRFFVRKDGEVEARCKPCERVRVADQKRARKVRSAEAVRIGVATVIGEARGELPVGADSDSVTDPPAA